MARVMHAAGEIEYNEVKCIKLRVIANFLIARVMSNEILKVIEMSQAN